MGKKAKEHRKKVAKRNANIKQQEKRVQKLWQEAFQEQMNKVKENYEKETKEKETKEKETIDLDFINSKVDELKEVIDNTETEVNDEYFEDLTNRINEIKDLLPDNEENLESDKTETINED